MILSFSCEDTCKLFIEGKAHRKCGWASVASIARRKLHMLHAAVRLEDLKIPPKNRLHQLQGNLSKFHAISINDQWRIIFIWKEGNAYEVKIIDYH